MTFLLEFLPLCCVSFNRNNQDQSSYLVVGLEKHLFSFYTGCFKIGKFRIQSMVGKDPVELVNTKEKKIRSS
jgi:hypothetical protein